MSLLDASSGETAGKFLGTLRSAAPEQLRGERPTPKMDIYAAGLVLYEMIAGRGPFDDEGDPHRIAAAHLHRMPTPISRYVPVPKELDALLFAVLAKDPDARPRDAFALAASLRNLKQALAAGIDSSRSRAARKHGGPVVSAGGTSPAATEVGMPPPTVGMAAGKHDALTPPEGNPALAVDRNAPTGTLAPATALVARHGTESLAPLPSPAVYPAMLEPTPPPVAFPTPVSPLPALVVGVGAHPSGVATQPGGKAPSPGLGKSAMVAMVTSIAVSTFLASLAIIVVARHQMALKRDPSAEPVATAAVLAAPPPVAAGQAQLQASGATELQSPSAADGGF
jgi:hypothetical protein